MANTNTGDRIRATTVMRGPSGDVMNVFYFRLESLLSVDDLETMQDIAEFLDAAFADINAGISSDYSYIEIRGFNMTQLRPLPTVPWTSLTAGGGGASSNAAGVALLIVLRTGISRVFGRKYLGGIITANIDTDGFWASALVTVGATFAAHLLGEFVGGTSTSTWLPGLIAKTGQFWSFIEAIVSAIPAYQRRRRKGAGS